MTTAETFGADATERPADDLAIRNLVARLAHLADMSGPDELDEYVGLFTEDAAWGMPESRGSVALVAGSSLRGPCWPERSGPSHH